MKLPTYKAGTTTPVGTADTPSGLSEINSRVESELDNTSLRFYGGDLLGNVWRFDLDNVVEPHGKALQLAELTTPPDPGLPEIAQPITTRPIVAEVEYNGSKFPVVYVATGQYLGTADVADKHRQSLYAIKDPMNNTALGKIRGRSDFVVQTITAPDAAQETRVSSDLRSTGSPRGAGASTSPWPASASRSTRRSPRHAVRGQQHAQGRRVQRGRQVAALRVQLPDRHVDRHLPGPVLVQGLTLVQLTEDGAGEGSIVTIITRSDGSVDEKITNPGTSGGVLRRSQWRELVD
ncbi:hypothetical protein HK414_03245 [Ramlibacter terrae]|uniref:PilC beta-propeller domain-containing protein n=1 Tax=Ramlibacter terrae TaxID=2732511 RepID=A0ABX6P1Q3_9BURK|nr:hypothetical protein HK414_03245 [Ramlibacter terrae]